MEKVSKRAWVVGKADVSGLGSGGTDSVNFTEILDTGLLGGNIRTPPGYFWTGRTEENRSSCATAILADSEMANPIGIRMAVMGSRVA